MAASTTITLDTTGPAGVDINIDSGAPYTSTLTVDAQPSTTDPDTTGYQMKLFSPDIDPLADPAVGPDEADSDWIAFATSYQVTLATGDGPKEINVRLRDDVGNESGIFSRQIFLDTSLPVPTVTIEAAPEKISEVDGFDVSTFTFSVDSDVDAWEVRAVPTIASGHSAGAVIPATNGSVNTTGGPLLSGQSREVTINGSDLKLASPADGTKVVKVFVQDPLGQWSV
jgi:hypothetical protein